MTVSWCALATPTLFMCGLPVVRESRGTWMKHRILVVEDDPAYGEFLKFWLESEGHEAILAVTLEDGFVAVASEPLPDVMLLDMNMGKHNGLTLAHWARRQRH